MTDGCDRHDTCEGCTSPAPFPADRSFHCPNARKKLSEATKERRIAEATARGGRPRSKAPKACKNCTAKGKRPTPVRVPIILGLAEGLKPTDVLGRRVLNQDGHTDFGRVDTYTGVNDQGAHTFELRVNPGFMLLNGYQIKGLGVTHGEGP